jgi:hypothetical protein
LKRNWRKRRKKRSTRKSVIGEEKKILKIEDIINIVIITHQDIMMKRTSTGANDGDGPGMTRKKAMIITGEGIVTGVMKLRMAARRV